MFKEMTESKLYVAIYVSFFIIGILFMAFVGSYPYFIAKSPQEIASLEGNWKISLEDQHGFSSPDFDDSGWDTISLPGSIIDYVIEKNNESHGILWLRKTVDLSSEIKKDKLGLVLGRIGNADETYFNGDWVGGLGGFPPDEFPMWNHPRNYVIPERLVQLGGDNVIAIRISYFAIGEVLGKMFITDYENWKRYRVVINFIQVNMGYVTISMGIALFVIFSFFSLKRRESEEYMFYCLQLLFGLPVVLEVCNYWHIYPNPLIRFKVLGLAWVALNVAHPIFLHRIYNLERRWVERGLWLYLGIMIFVCVFFTNTSLVRLHGVILIFLTTLIGFYNFTCHISALINKSPYAKIFSFFGITVVLCAIHDGFVYFAKFSGVSITIFGFTPTIMVFHVGAIFLYMGTSLVLVYRFINIVDEVETLNSSLENFIIENTLLSEKLQESSGKKSSVAISSIAEEKIKRVMAYINENFLAELSREELASSVGVHPDSLGKQFKKYTGKKLGDYIYELRINEAARRLREEDTNIIDIAFDVGFESVRTFNRIFPKFMKVTPNNYRKLYSRVEDHSGE